MAIAGYKGYKWGSATIGSEGGFVTWSLGKPSYLDNTFSAEIQGEYARAVQSAFAIWEAFVDIDFREQFDSNFSDIRVGWQVIDGISGAAGLAQAWFPGGLLDRVVVTFDSADPWVPFSDGSASHSLLSTALHEIGHAIGLEHFPNPNSSMYPAYNGRERLTTDVVAVAQAIYGAPQYTDRSGDAQANTFYAMSGHELIDGGAGRDRFVALTMRDSATALRLDDQTVLVATSLTTAALTSVERVDFIDGTLAFDADGNAGQAYRLYQAAFDRTPDRAGLTYQVSRLDTGVALGDVAAGFAASPEFKAVYGAQPSTNQIVQTFYQNVLGRPGEASGIAFYENRLNSGDSVGNVLASFAESPENKALVQPAIDDGIWLL